MTYHQDLRKLLEDVRKYLDSTPQDSYYKDDLKQLRARIDAALADPVEPVAEVHVIFDGPPSHESGRFVECENADGKSINAGRWEQRGRYWHLILNAAPAEQDRVDAERYRWIRENGDKGIFVFDPDKKPRIELAQRDELDTLIDRARSAK